MEVIKTNIDGVVIIEPKVFKDSRGYFFESFSQREFMNQRTKQEQSQACLSYALRGGGRPKVRGVAQPWA